MNPWIALTLAGLLEIAWALGIKYTDGFSKLLPSLATGAAMAGSFYFLALAIKTIPIGTAYAVWVGIGAVGVALAGMVFFSEPASAPRVLCIALIIAGVVGLKYWSGSVI